jgi:hypothetical protein
VKKRTEHAGKLITDVLNNKIFIKKIFLTLQSLKKNNKNKNKKYASGDTKRKNIKMKNLIFLNLAAAERTVKYNTLLKIKNYIYNSDEIVTKFKAEYSNFAVKSSILKLIGV